LLLSTVFDIPNASIWLVSASLVFYMEVGWFLLVAAYPTPSLCIVAVTPRPDVHCGSRGRSGILLSLPRLVLIVALFVTLALRVEVRGGMGRRIDKTNYNESGSSFS